MRYHLTLGPIRRFCCKQISRLGEALHRFLDRRQPGGTGTVPGLDMSYLSRSGKESNPAFVIVCEIRGHVGYSWKVPVRFDRQVTRIYGPGSSDRSAGSAVGPRSRVTEPFERDNRNPELWIVRDGYHRIRRAGKGKNNTTYEISTVVLAGIRSTLSPPPLYQELSMTRSSPAAGLGLGDHLCPTR